MQNVSRRTFLKRIGAAGLGCWISRVTPVAASCLDLIPPEGQAGYGPMVPDPQGVLNLPEGFSYKIISRAKEVMDDGFFVPGHPDGMGTFPGPEGLTIVMRNHEVWPGFPPSKGAFGDVNQLKKRVRRNIMYDWGRRGASCLGAVTTLVYDTRHQELKSQFLTLTGTLANCSGGATPWNTWISCEEEFQSAGWQYARDHGYAFEVPVSLKKGVRQARPLQSLGRFIHEAVAVPAKTGIVYQTEDQSDSLFYRFLPLKPQDLSQGRLQCLAVSNRPGLDTRNWRERVFSPGESFAVVWIDLEEVNPDRNDLRIRGRKKGGAIFANGEGISIGGDFVYFDCTYGGPAKSGQIWRYRPSPFEGTPRESEAPPQLELFLEPLDKRILYNPDQMTNAPWGDLLVCEDNPLRQILMGITPDRSIYLLAQNVMDDSELAGVCFSPDGSTMFVNMQNAGLTFAVTGPWKDATA